MGFSIMMIIILLGLSFISSFAYYKYFEKENNFIHALWFSLLVLVCNYFLICIEQLKFISISTYITGVSLPVTIVLILSLAGLQHIYAIIRTFSEKKKAAAKDAKNNIVKKRNYNSSLEAEQHKSVDCKKRILIFCACVFVSFLAELTLFNYHHYITLWADKPIDIVSCTKTLANATQNSDNTYIQNPAGGSSIEIQNINRKISTVYIQPKFLTSFPLMQKVTIEYDDQECSKRKTPEITLVKGFSPNNYIDIASCGNVSRIKINFNATEVQNQNQNVQISDIVLNQPIPLDINLIRILLISLALFGLWAVKNTNLMHIKFDSKSKTQNVVQCFTIVFVIGVAFFNVMTSLPYIDDAPAKTNYLDRTNDEYTTGLLDSLMHGHVYIDTYNVSQQLLQMNDPYNYQKRADENVPFTWDAVYHNGKYYSYYGIVPLLVLFIPFNYFTHAHLGTHMGVFIFSSLAFIFLILLWREIVRRYLKNMSFIMYILGCLTLSVCSLIPYICRRPEFYEVPIAAGLFFLSAGFWLLLKSTVWERLSFLKLTISCLCFALAVGCKADLVLASAFVPIFVFPWIKKFWQKNKKKFIKIILSIAVPYSLIAWLLMWYNYARFGSVTEFGVIYQMTTANMGAYKFLNPIEKINKVLLGVYLFIFDGLNFGSSWPFVSTRPIDSQPSLLFNGYLYVCGAGVFGLANFPVLWNVAVLPKTSKSIRKTSPQLWFAVIAMLIISAAMMVSTILVAGVHTRYAIDFTWMLLIVALICMYFINDYLEIYPKVQSVVLKIFCLMMIISIMLMLLESATGEFNRMYFNNPRVYYFLERTFEFR
ncbi:MAG: hypothetical protein Q8876_01855 [Bacillota bacterium]|nr:hypothetical protein [Bacillota bacterium]